MKERMTMAKENLFYNRLLELVKLSRKSMNQIERELGYTRNALHNYKTGSDPSARRLLEISSYFGVKPEYLLGIDLSSKKSKETSVEVQEFIQKLELVTVFQKLINIQVEILNDINSKSF
jgi:transcriptional regulator with XRE-family HTH domain